jgi:hypothetical protein
MPLLIKAAVNSVMWSEGVDRVVVPTGDPLPFESKSSKDKAVPQHTCGVSGGEEVYLLLVHDHGTR